MAFRATRLMQSMRTADRFSLGTVVPNRLKFIHVIKNQHVHARLQQNFATEPSRTSFDLHVLYDGSCPLCVKEIALLKRLKTHDELKWVDISMPHFDTAVYGKDIDAFMAEMHVCDSRSRQHYTGMEAFRQMYKALGYGWLWSWTAVWPFCPVADAAYASFARNRHRLASWMR